MSIFVFLYMCVVFVFFISVCKYVWCGFVSLCMFVCGWFCVCVCCGVVVCVGGNV